MTPPPAPHRPVSLLGLGPMGAPMAENLVRRLGALTVWNRTPGRAASVVALGAREAASPAEAARDVVLTVLPDLAEVESLLPGPEGLLAGWHRTGTREPILVVHGTVSPAAVRAFAEDLWVNYRVRVIDAPMSGGVPGAEEGSLSLMVGGEQHSAQSLTPVFAAIAGTVVYLGSSGSGQLAKPATRWWWRERSRHGARLSAWQSTTACNALTCCPPSPAASPGPRC